MIRFSILLSLLLLTCTAGFTTNVRAAKMNEATATEATEPEDIRWVPCSNLANQDCWLPFSRSTVYGSKRSRHGSNH